MSILNGELFKGGYFIMCFFNLFCLGIVDFQYILLTDEMHVVLETI